MTTSPSGRIPASGTAPAGSAHFPAGHVPPTGRWSGPRPPGWPATGPPPGPFGGRFDLRAPLGRGAHATVYRALDVQRGVEVAVKVLGRLDEKATARFAREAEALGRLRHPSIVEVLGTGVADGLPWVAEELIPGRPLADLADLRTASPTKAAEWVRDLGKALDYAHLQGVIHRDVKPENVVVDGQGRPRLVDFGIAWVEGASPGLTSEGSPLGSPGYMAPEQVRGGPATPQVDVHGLGATLYTLLVGVPPYSSIGETIDAPPPRPSAKAPRVPAALDAIVLRCLAKEPAARYPGPGALVRDLERFLEGPSEPPPTSRLSLVLATSGAVALVLALVVVVVGRSAPPAPAPPPVAPAPPLPVVVAPPPPTGPELAAELETVAAAPEPDLGAVRAARAALAAHPELVGVSSRRASGSLVARALEVAATGGRFRQDLVERLLLAAELVSDDVDAEASALLAAVDYLLRRYRPAEALEVARRVRAGGPLGLEARYQVANCLRRVGQKAEGKAQLTKLADERPDEVIGLLARATLRSNDWDYDQSMALARRILEVEPANRRALHLLSLALSFRRQPEEALEVAEIGAKLAPDDGTFAVCAGFALERLDRPDEAEAAFTRAMSLAAPAFHAQAVKWRGVARLHAGRFALAIEDLDAVVDHEPDDADNLMWRGAALWYAGRRDEARRDWKTASGLDAAFCRRRVGDLPRELHQVVLDSMGGTR